MEGQFEYTDGNCTTEMYLGDPTLPVVRPIGGVGVIVKIAECKVDKWEPIGLGGLVALHTVSCDKHDRVTVRVTGFGGRSAGSYHHIGDEIEGGVNQSVVVQRTGNILVGDTVEFSACHDIAEAVTIFEDAEGRGHMRFHCSVMTVPVNLSADERRAAEIDALFGDMKNAGSVAEVDKD